MTNIISLINVNDATVSKMYSGANAANKAYMGNRLVYTCVASDVEPIDYDYLCFTANQSDSSIGMTHYGDNQTSTKPVIYISTDKKHWTEWDYTIITLSNVGDKVWMYGDNSNGISHSNSNYSTFTMVGSISASGDCTTLLDQYSRTGIPTYGFYRLFAGCRALTTAPSLPATYVGWHGYASMFNRCSSLVTPPALPATSLGIYCYYSMFYDCTSLTTAPELPATTLAICCYGNMFNGCTSLTTAPALPATTLAEDCYSAMFQGCTSLTTAPELPATTLDLRCYQYMFAGCTSLTTAPTVLPATTLKQECYSGMFRGCTSLTTAPELPAAYRVYKCYNEMFYGCTNLSFIKCLASDEFSTDYGVTDWVYGVAASGTFIKAQSMSRWSSGDSGIPSGWTIDTYTKNITFSGSYEPFSYTIGTTTTNVTVGTSIVETLTYPQSVSVTTDGPKYHLFINNNNKGNGPDYTLSYTDLANGDVLTCVYDNEPS